MITVPPSLTYLPLLHPIGGFRSPDEIMAHPVRESWRNRGIGTWLVECMSRWLRLAAIVW